MPAGTVSQHSILVDERAKDKADQQEKTKITGEKAE
jgi:hypothetical protein